MKRLTIWTLAILLTMGALAQGAPTNGAASPQTKAANGTTRDPHHPPKHVTRKRHGKIVNDTQSPSATTKTTPPPSPTPTK